MSQPISQVSRNENIPSLPETQSSCLPNCVTEALQSVANLFSRIGLANLIGVSAIVLAASVFDALAGVVAAVIFCVAKIFTPRPGPGSGSEAPPHDIIPLPPAPPMRVEVLPPGTIRSQYAQHNIWTHRYDVTNLNLQEPDLVAALTQQLPARYHNQTCCAMAATAIDYFYQHGFTHLTPIKLDALLAKAVHVDRVIRHSNPRLGQREIDIIELSEALDAGPSQGVQHGLLPAFQINPHQLPIQKELTPNDPQANIAPFRDLLTQFFNEEPGAGRLAGSLLLNGHFNGDPTGHFTGLCIDRNDQGQILQIYVTESMNCFPGGVRCDSGDNRRGAMVVPIGNTVEAAAAQLARFFSGNELATLYQVVAPI